MKNNNILISSDLYSSDNVLIRSLKSVTSLNCPNIDIVADSAVSNNTHLRDIRLPRCKYIGSMAFANCTELERCQFGGSFSVGSRAFYNCSAISDYSFLSSATEYDSFALAGTTQDIGLSVLSNAVIVKSKAFAQSSTGDNLLSLYVPNLQYISPDALIGSNCLSIDVGADNTVYEMTDQRNSLYTSMDNELAIVIPSTTSYQNSIVTGVRAGVFQATPKLSSIDLPAVQTIGLGEFSSMTELVHANLPKIRRIPQKAFYDCCKLSSLNVGGDQSIVTSIGANAFSYCAKLSGFQSNSLKVVNDGAFSHCDDLQSFAAPNLTRISESQFEGDWRLSTIAVSPLLQSIGEMAFSGCHSLSTIEFNNQDGISLGARCFYDCTSLIDIKNSKYIKNIPEYAFYQCALSSFELSPTVTAISAAAFSGCKALTSIELPEDNQMKIIDYSVFSNTGLISVHIPENWVVNGSGVFSECSNLSAILIETNYTDLSVPYMCYWNCTNLVSVEFGHPDKLVAVDEQAFNSTGLSSWICPDNVKNIEANAFYGCPNMAIVDLPSSLTSLADTSFASCKNLSVIHVDENNQQYRSLPNEAGIHCMLVRSDDNSIMYIANSAMQQQSVTGKFTKLVIPDGVRHISEYAFSTCSADITDIYLSKTFPSNLADVNSLVQQWRNSTSGRLATLETIEVDPANQIVQTTSSKLGLIVNDDGTRRLVMYADANQTETTFIFSDNIDEFGSDVFFRPSAISAVDFTNSNVTRIPPNAFAGSSIAKVVFNDKVNKLESYSLANMQCLSSVDLTPTNITSIGSYAFKDDVCLTSIEFNDKLVDIQEYGLASLPNLVSVDLSQTQLTTISRSTFENDQNLTSIVLPSELKSIAESGIKSCRNLRTVTLPQTLESIGSCAFQECKSLSTIALPQTITSIGDFAFEYCYSLSTLTLPENVTDIGSCAFRYCGALSTVNLPSTITYIGGDAFSYCTALSSIDLSQTRLKYLCESFGYTSLTSISFPSSLTGIGYAAFRNIKQLTSINLLSTEITDIDNYIIEGADNLVEICLPRTVSSISECAFNSAPSKTKIMFDMPMKDIKTIEGYPWGATPNQITCMPFWTYRVDVVDDVVKTKMSDDGFVHASLLEYGPILSTMVYPSEIDILDKTKIIYRDGSSVKQLSEGSLDSSSIKNITEVKSINVGLAVTSLGNNAFESCSNLTSITIPNSVTLIGSRVFYGCSNLISIAIPNSVTSIGSSAFNNCSGLRSITIPNSVTSIGDYAFDSCSNLTSISIPDSVTTIGLLVFSHCSNLTTITIPNSVTTIGRQAFQYCSNLKTLTIPDSVTSIGSYAFQYCSNLTSITIPDSVASIGAKAFQQCPSLNIYVPNQTIKDLCSGKGVDDRYIHISDS